MITASQERINEISAHLVETEAISSVWQVLSKEGLNSAGSRIPDGVKMSGDAFADTVHTSVSCVMASHSIQEMLRHKAKRLKKGKVPLDSGVAVYFSVMDPQGGAMSSGVHPIQAYELLRCVGQRKSKALADSIVGELVKQYVDDFSQIGAVTIVLETLGREELQKCGPLGIVDMNEIPMDADDATLDEALERSAA